MRNEVQITAVGEGTDLTLLRAATDVATAAFADLGMAVVVGMVHRPDEEDVKDPPAPAAAVGSNVVVLHPAGTGHPGQYL